MLVLPKMESICCVSESILYVFVVVTKASCSGITEVPNVPVVSSQLVNVAMKHKDIADMNVENSVFTIRDYIYE